MRVIDLEEIESVPDAPTSHPFSATLTARCYLALPYLPTLIPMPQYDLIRSSRRKTVSIEVHRNQRVVVRAPEHMDQHEILRLVVNRKDWINQQRYRQASLPQKPGPVAYHDDSHHYLFGTTLRLKYARVLRIEHQGDLLLVPENLISFDKDMHQDFSQTEKALHQWYRRQANLYFQQRLQYWLAQTGHWQVDFTDLKLRYMRRYWGSCNSRGYITLNVHLIKVPPALIDYVISHECCHLMEMNHSPAFYLLQETLLPDWRQRRQHIRDWEMKVLP